MTKQPWLCKAIPEEVWGKAWNPPPCPSSPLSAWFLLPRGVSNSPFPSPFSRTLYSSTRLSPPSANNVVGRAQKRGCLHGPQGDPLCQF